jgi:glycosyltransferase involved in cell wall biosynthesis
MERGHTGIAQYIFSLTRALAAQAGGHEFTLFVLEEDLPSFDCAKTRMHLVPVAERFRPAGRNIFWHQMELPRLARELELDVLHVPSDRRMLWSRPCALVATIHDLAPFRLKRHCDGKRMVYGQMIMPRLARRQHEIIAVSQRTALGIATCLRVPAERVTVVYNGVDRERFFPGSREASRSEVAERFELRQPFFLHVAWLEHPDKNHVQLIEAFSRFKAETRSSWQLALGWNDCRVAETIRKAIRQSPSARDIRCLGFVPERDLPSLYRGADVFVCPSLDENFGLPPVEAMACGCPVLCSTGGVPGEFVGEAAVAVDTEDVEAMTRQLSRLASDRDLRERLRATGLAHAQQFDWTKAATATAEVYSRAAARAVSTRVVLATARCRLSV